MLDLSDPALANAVDEVCDPSEETNYALFGYTDKTGTKLKLVETGEDGLDELIESLTDGKILFALVSMDVNNTQKLLYVAWCGSCVQGAAKVHFAGHSEEVKKIFPNFNLQITAYREEDLDESSIATQISKLTGGRTCDAKATGNKPNFCPPSNASYVPPTVETLQDRPVQTQPARPKGTSGDVSSRMEKLQIESSTWDRKYASSSPRVKSTRYDDEAIRKKQEEELEANINRMKELFNDLTEDNIRDCCVKFRQYDLTATGKLTWDEYWALRVDNAQNVSLEMLKRLAKEQFSSADATQKGALTLEEFVGNAPQTVFGDELTQVAGMLKDDFPNLDMTQIKEALSRFRKFDIDGSGQIDMDEFYQLVAEMTDDVSKLMLRYMSEKLFKETDKDDSGEIDEAEFLQAYNKIMAEIEKGKCAETQNKRRSRQSFIALSDDRISFTKFAGADSCDSIQQRFDELLEASNITRTPDTDIFEELRARLMVDPIAKKLWQTIDERRKQQEYTLNCKEPPRVLVVGGGPGGIRMAIEAALLGCRVVLLEKRRKFTRHNLLHLWPSTIKDFNAIGFKSFFGKFCIGGIFHCSIRRIQCVLLKIALLLGVEFFFGATFEKVLEPEVSESDPTGRYWRAQASTKQDPIPDRCLRYNVLIACDGADSHVAKLCGFEMKLCKGAQALGITANFINKGTTAENQVDEFAIMSIYKQDFFNMLRDKYNLKLENLVYYRGETHYFVMAAVMDSLVKKGVLREARDPNNPSFLLARDNINPLMLTQLIKEVAKEVNLPVDELEFALDSRSRKPDVSIFDFSVKKQSVQPCKLLKPADANSADDRKLLVTLVGDALVEPFWPQGTGMNRALLSAMDTAWKIKTWRESIENLPADQEVEKAEENLMQDWLSSYKVLMAAEPTDLEPDFSKHTIDPASRYKKTSHGAFH